MILLRIRVGDFCSLGVWSFTTSPSLFSQQLSAGKNALLLKDASRKGRWRRERAAEVVLENDADGRRLFENVLKGDECFGLEAPWSLIWARKCQRMVAVLEAPWSLI